jgi:Leucine-rich repeat (LRR) protein
MRDKVYDVKTKTYKMIRQQLKCIPYRQIPKETEHLILMENEIEEIPGELFETHVNLKTIEMYGNRLREIPESIINLRDTLEVLNVEANRLERLPEGIGELSRLYYLSVGGNRLKTLPESFVELNGGGEFDFGYGNGNPNEMEYLSKAVVDKFGHRIPNVDKVELI